MLGALDPPDEGIVINILIGVQHGHNRNMRAAINREYAPDRPSVREPRQPIETPICGNCRRSGDQWQYKDEMAHAVEQHGLDDYGIRDREDNPDAEDEARERLLSAQTEIATPKRDHCCNRNTHQQDENELRQREGDISREISPRQVVCRHKLAIEQRVKRKRLM